MASRIELIQDFAGCCTVTNAATGATLSVKEAIRAGCSLAETSPVMLQWMECAGPPPPTEAVPPPPPPQYVWRPPTDNADCYHFHSDGGAVLQQVVQHLEDACCEAEDGCQYSIAMSCPTRCAEVFQPFWQTWYD